MSDEMSSGESLPVRGATHEERVILVRSLMVDWDVLDHLKKHKALGMELSMMRADGCCKPDGGSCCVNKQP
jgi:hypothetical protein